MKDPRLTWLDRFIQTRRMRKAMAHIPDQARVLDIGAHDGRLFELLGPRLGAGVGVDPEPTHVGTSGNVELKAGRFPGVDVEGPFDRICMLAVAEHIPQEEHDELAEACNAVLAPGGRLIVTVPSPFVDVILKWLTRFRLVHGIEIHQHYGLRPDDIATSFSKHMPLVKRKRFQFGLNNLFVFERRD